LTGAFDQRIYERKGSLIELIL